MHVNIKESTIRSAEPSVCSRQRGRGTGDAAGPRHKGCGIVTERGVLGREQRRSWESSAGRARTLSTGDPTPAGAAEPKRRSHRPALSRPPDHEGRVRQVPNGPARTLWGSLHFAPLRTTARGAPHGIGLQAFWRVKGSVADDLGRPVLIPVLLTRREQQGTATATLTASTEKGSASNRWKTVGCPVRPLHENGSDPSDLFAPAPPPASRHSTNIALQLPCFYLGVKEQRGGSQVLLLEGTHRVCHLPLLHPAGQQHRGLRTPTHSQTIARGASATHVGLFPYRHERLLLDATNYDPRYPKKALGTIRNQSPSFGQCFFSQQTDD